jgi:hypothetical protein
MCPNPPPSGAIRGNRGIHPAGEFNPGSRSRQKPNRTAAGKAGQHARTGASRCPRHPLHEPPGSAGVPPASREPKTGTRRRDASAPRNCATVQRSKRGIGRRNLYPHRTFFRIRLSGLGMRSCYARNQPDKKFVQSLGCDSGHGNAREATDSQLRRTP